MAKSLRSKRKRKVRAEKRIVNAKKELVKLKEIAAKLHGSEKEDDPTCQVVPMSVEGSASAAKRSGGVKIDNRWMNQRKIKAIKSKIKKHNKKRARRVR